jgi:Rps23 Pro-64 3,4-dihydroxylase Tpa1-like proline 4-hydroxylase
MFNINQIYKIDNFLNETEVAGFDHFCEHYVWELNGFSHSTKKKIFWRKDFWQPKWGKCEPIEQTFTTKIELLLNIKLQTEDLYLNGQAHGQCGSIHTDVLEESDEESDYMTAVYYVNKTWSPELGGYTVIIDNSDNMHIVYPKPNSIVIFNSGFPHVGLEPTMHCRDQRVTLAHKFKVLKNDN